MKPYEPRTYRSLVSEGRLTSFRVVVKETDLFVRVERPLETETRDLVIGCRNSIERYIEGHPEFVRSLTPLPQDDSAPLIVKKMIAAGREAGVGPMASVAGAIAEHVGQELTRLSRDVIVENGGDIFIRTGFPLVAAILAGRSPLSNKIGVRIDSPDHAMGVCTSSGTVGHSLSFGRADAAVVISESVALADAAATAIGNRVADRRDVERAIDLGKEIRGVRGIVVIVGDNIGFWGGVELVRI